MTVGAHGVDAPRMPIVLATLLVLVALYCLVRAVAPRLGGGRAEHRRDVDAWHVVMASVMAAMLLGDLSRPAALAALGVAVAAACWGVLGMERRSGRAAQVRLVVGAAAMAVMTLPLAGPAEADSARHTAPMAGMSSGSSRMPPVLLLIVLLGALTLVGVTRVPTLARRSTEVVPRVDAGCDVVMAGAMAVMLAALL